MSDPVPSTSGSGCAARTTRGGRLLRPRPRLALAAAQACCWSSSACRSASSSASTTRACSDGNPAHTVQQNARGKAEEVLARERLRPGELVLGVDTVVVSEGEILGKARDEDEAASFVRRLAARRHEVYSGLYLTSRKVALASHAVTGVTFRSLDRRRARRLHRAPASGATGPAPTPSRASARRWCSASTATTSTSSACRSPSSSAAARRLRRHAVLLAARHGRRQLLAARREGTSSARRTPLCAACARAAGPGLPSGGHAQRHRIQSSFEIRFERSSPSASSDS